MFLPYKFFSAGEKYSTYTEPIPAPIFRKSFVASSGEKAKLIIGATGFYDLFLNGKKITDGYLAPFITNPDHVIFYNEYDLTDRLADGENVIGVMLGNGFANPIGGEVWKHGEKRSSAPAFALRFESASAAFGAEDMRWNYSHILFDDYRCGTYCDMTKELVGWDKAFYDDSEWSWPTLSAHDFSKSEKRLARCEPVRETGRISPVEIFSGELREYRMRSGFSDIIYNGDTVMEKTPHTGGYIYDFGENAAGVPLLKIRGKKGQKIHMQFCELMFEGFADYINTDVYPDGCAQKDVYVCSGRGVEEYIPPFTYHGFRYCYVYGITKEQATKDLLTYLVLHNDVPILTEFSCSDNVSELIFDACRRSDLSNLFYILTDCPQREKNGWTGDAAISAEHFLLNYGVEKCFSDWLRCISAAQDEDGRIPLIVPSGQGKSECPVWDSVIFLLPYYIYVYTGDKNIILDNVESMMKNLRFSLSLRDERGIVESGYGDWLPVDRAADDYASPLGFCCTAVLMDVCEKVSAMLDAVGMTSEAAYAAHERQKLREALRSEYNDCGVITAGKSEKYRRTSYRPCQTSQALGLYTGVFDENEKKKAAEILVNLIKNNDNGFDCGFLGLRVIFHVLSEYGYSDLAYEMITKPSHPSYANMIYRGETSIWERFVKPGGRIGSHNHHFMADVSAWYLKCVAGINIDPDSGDPDRIYLEPRFISSLDFVKASRRTRGGKIEVEWKRNGDTVDVRVTTEGRVTVKYGRELIKSNITVNGVVGTLLN